MQPKTILTRSSSHILTLIINIIFLALPFPKVLCSDKKFEACAPSSCGNLSIRYPFWIHDKQDAYCGHPSFMITCKNNKNPILRISIDDYLITHIEYLNHTFHLANAIFYDDTITCPTPLNNISIENTPFDFVTDDANFLLFYNCSSLPSAFHMNYPLSCAIKSGSSYKTFGDFHFEELGQWNYSLSLCQSVVAVPVSIEASPGFDEASIWHMNYKQILKQGFTLNWTVPDCGGCEGSGGRCGFDVDQFVCFCRDKPHSKNCHDEEAKRNATILGVGLAATSSIILLSIVYVIYLHRRKKKRSSTPLTSQYKFSSISSATSDLQSPNKSTYFGVQVFGYKELEEATDNFNPQKELGDGGFGTVYYGKLYDGREVAIKRLYENNKRGEQFMNEVEILAHLRHKNLVNLYGCTSRQSHELLLVYEYVSNGTVADHLHGKRTWMGKLPWHRRLNIAIETASALVYLHVSDIIHRDVKTQNILLDKDFTVKVADFGLSRLFPLDVTHVSTAPQGTPGYVDPEYHQCYHLTEKSDVYSFGVVLAELISSKPAVDITRRRQDINLSNMAVNKIQNQVLHELVDPSLGFDTDLKVKNEISAVAELAFQCLHSSREIRPSMQAVLVMLSTIQGNVNDGANEADVVDLPSVDVLMLKCDLSPISPPPRDADSEKQNRTHASI